MNTLHEPRVKELLDHLFEDAARVDGPMRDRLTAMSPDERAVLLAHARSDWQTFYGTTARDLYLPVSRETGVLLYALGRACGARSVVEFGTSFGLSTIHLAAAVRDNGGGLVIGTELEPIKAARARRNLEAAGLSELVEIREGDALTSLADNLPERLDFVLLDGAKGLYPAVLERLAPRLRSGAVLVADNADDAPEYLARVRAPGGPFVSLPFGPEVEVTVRA